MPCMHEQYLYGLGHEYTSGHEYTYIDMLDGCITLLVNPLKMSIYNKKCPYIFKK